MGQLAASIDPHETLSVPKKRRFVHEYVAGDDGRQELRVYFGLKEITFDEPEFVAFGARLIEQDSFVAGSATAWSGGEPYPWDRVKEMLETLLAEGVIERGPAARAAGDASAAHRAFLEAEAARQDPPEPLWWLPASEGVFERLTGRPLELGYLETVIPVHRVAHAALDAEGRHVGEINVFPDAMRRKVPTEWRACPYPGSRYQDDLPMNVTALQAMTRHWRPVLQACLAARDEFLRRYPLGPDGRWALGDLHAFACATLGVPTLQLARARDPVPNGALDPVLSSLFRLVDGVRIVSIYLLFLPEQPRTYDTPITAAELHQLTERENHFLSTRGVCAGPPHMVDEFLATLVDGKPVAKGPAPLGDWAADVAAGVDYGLYGVQLYAAVFALWVRMGLAYQKVREALAAAPDVAGPRVAALRARVESDWQVVLPGRLNQPAQRAWSEARYAEMYERAQRGLPGGGAGGAAAMPFAAVLTPAPGLLGAGALVRLRGALRSLAGAPAAGPALDAAAEALLEYLRVERTALGTVVAVQRKINALLGRPHPARPLSGFDLAIHHHLRVSTLGGLPYLLDAFRDELGLDVENTAGATRVAYGAESCELA